MINIWMPVFNEQAHLQHAIESVLGQTFANFTLLISDNHSTDGSAAIIREACAKDSRIQVFSPPRHLTGLEHTAFVSSELLPQASTGKYSIFIGGHDRWEATLLSVLWDRAESEPDAAVVYTDSYEFDEAGRIVKRHQGIFQTKEVARPFIPIQVLMSLTHNLVWGGLWRESIRQSVRARHHCSAADHLMLAEIALRGAILYQPGSAVFLGPAKNAGNWIAYSRKHIPENIRRHPILDFLNQLEWCDHLIEQAVAGGEYGQEPFKSMLKSSLFSAYILRYVDTLRGQEGGLEAFFAHPAVQSYLHSNVGSAVILGNLLQSRTKAYPT